MAAIVETRKRCVAAFLDEPFPAPPHLAKRGRFTPYAGSMAQAAPMPLAFDAVDVLRRAFPDANPRDLESFFAASGRDIHAAVQACRTQQARDALAHRLAHAADDDECAGILVEQMAAATDAHDAKIRASWILGLIMNGVAERAARDAAAEAATLRDENAVLRKQAERGTMEAAKAREENAALSERTEAAERDSAVLKRGVLAQQRRYEEMERAAAATKKKMAELEMANYALSVRLRDADGCRFQEAHRGPDVF